MQRIEARLIGQNINNGILVTPNILLQSAAMISLTDVVLQRGGKILLDGVSLVVHSGQRVGFIGGNGCGKSSLFQLLMGKLQPDQGDVSLPRQLRIAHMAQEVAHTDRKAIDYVLDGDTALRLVEQQLRSAEQNEDNQALASAYAEWDTVDGHSAPSRAQQLMYGLGFKAGDDQRPVSGFSGGWRIRLNLAQALMCPSDLLLLDEPTNHLDLDAALWLEQWLLRYQGTLLFISHDRDFLDAVSTHIGHFEQRQIAFYTGNYSAYERQRAERLAQRQAQYQQQQQRISEMQGFVDRFRAKATKARQAQSRIKALEKMELIEAAHVDSPFHFTFFEPQKISNPLLTLRQSELGYGQQSILRQVDISILQGSRIGLLGRNGAGKSTLLKSLTDELSPLSGDKTCAENLRLGYFAQHQLEALDINASALLHLQRLSPNASEQSIRRYLGGFNFRGDEATGPITHFSGGEKARLALAIVVWQKPNLLILDEPTNHLDLDMRQALTAALQSFSGAVILVSHDRHLMRNSVDQFLLVESGTVRDFDGDLDDYQHWLTRSGADREAGNGDTQNTPFKPDRKAQRRLAAQKREQLAPLTRKLKKLEKLMAANEQELTDIEGQLHRTDLYDSANKEELQQLLQRQGKLRQQLDLMEEEWLAVSEELEQSC